VGSAGNRFLVQGSMGYGKRGKTCTVSNTGEHDTG